jgi:ribosomal protein S18 acetylase RimI-like enzyme
MRHLRIRVAQPEDAGRLSELAMASKAHWGYAPEILDTWRAELTLGPADILQHPVYVAEGQNKIVGFYMLRPDTTRWTLEHLWVDPSAMRQGVGTCLFRHALGIATERQAMRLVAIADPHAAGFYEHVGGVQCGATFAPLAGSPNRLLPVYEFQTGIIGP